MKVLVLPALLLALAGCDAKTPEQAAVATNAAMLEASIANQAAALEALATEEADRNAAEAIRDAADNLQTAGDNVADAAGARIDNLR